MKIVHTLFCLLLCILISSCAGDGGLKGNLTVSITDSPIDADHIKSVNIFFSRVDIKKGGEWKSLKSFDQPIGVNLLEYTGGNSYPLITQLIDPGKYASIRFTLNLAEFNSSFIRNPQCDVSFEDGSTAPIYMFESGVVDIEVVQEMNLDLSAKNDFTFDFDVRKSLTLNEQGYYIFKPVIRGIETARAGHIRGAVTNINGNDRLVVFAYAAGQFNSAETATPASGEVRFAKAVTSGKINQGSFGLGFLPAGNYDLIFAKHSASGEFMSLSGHFNGVTVVAGETVQLDIDLDQLSGS